MFNILCLFASNFIVDFLLFAKHDTLRRKSRKGTLLHRLQYISVSK